MPGISSPGVGSGLDVKTIVEALVKADITPAKNRLDRQEAKLSTQLSALGQVKSALAKLQGSMNKLSTLSQFQSLTATVSNTSTLTASITGSNTVPGNYQIEVQQLATQQSLASAPFASTTSTLGSGSLTIQFGTYSSGNTSFTPNPNQQAVTITIDPNQSSLLAIQELINNSNAGVQASIVQDQSGARLTLISNNTGQASAMRISVVDNDGNNTDNLGLSSLAYDPTTTVTNLTQTVAATDSQVLINGLTLTQSTNALNTAIEGVNINLLTAQPGVPVTLSISNNQQQTTNLVNDFIEQYNNMLTTINSLTAYNQETKKMNVLQGDAEIRNLQFNLTSIVGKHLDYINGPIKSLADIGIKADRKGLLQLDSSVFNKVLNNNYAAIGTIFAKTGTATDPQVKVSSIGIDIQAGLYGLELGTYTPGVSLAGTISGVPAVSSDGLTLTGTKDFGELSLEILGGSTGNRGFIEIKDGFAAQLYNLISNYLGEGGELSDRTDTLGEYMKDIDDQRQNLAMRAISLTERYTKQFTALDTLLMKMQSTSQFLTQQIDNLPISQINNKRK